MWKILEWNTSANLKHSYTFGGRHPSGCKAVFRCDDITHDIIDEFTSVAAAARFIGISSATLSLVLCKRRASAGGYWWKYVSETTKEDKPEGNWKPIEGYPNYEINDIGIVWNVATNNRISTWNNNGYSLVTLWSNGKQKNHSVHGLVATTFLIKPCDSKLVVNHLDGKRDNNEINNLEWCTPSENTQHYWNQKQM